MEIKCRGYKGYLSSMELTGQTLAGDRIYTVVINLNNNKDYLHLNGVYDNEIEFVGVCNAPKEPSGLLMEITCLDDTLPVYILSDASKFLDLPEFEKEVVYNSQLYLTRKADKKLGRVISQLTTLAGMLYQKTGNAQVDKILEVYTQKDED